jgi:hypothetical protein
MSWRDGPARQAIVEFVERVCGKDGSAAGAVDERVAVFDNDGTLWCEKPMPIQLDFILRRFVEMAEAQPELRERQPWKAAYERDYGWLSALMSEHYAGNDTDVRTLAAGILAAYAGISVDDFEKQSDAFLRSAQHPTLGRGYLCCPALKMSTKPALMVRTCGCEKTPPGGCRAGSWCSTCRFDAQSAVTSATAARAEDSSTIDLLAANAATRDWMARLLTVRG